MKILLFGGSGQLGREIQNRLGSLRFEVVSPVASELSIDDQEQVSFLIDKVRADVVINCAAYTAVDDAEKESETAFSVNAEGPSNLARSISKTGGRLIHISTDYVFDGSLGRALTEEDPTSPLNVYGQSKLAGEKAVLELLPDTGLIVRTSSLHGQFGQNFVHTMLQLFESREEVMVVEDQLMSPTWAGWLAGVLIDLCRISAKGVLHASGTGPVSWYEFAQEIYRLTGGSVSYPNLTILPTSVSSFPRPAKRPINSALDCGRLEQLLGRAVIPWQEGLNSHLQEMGRLAG